MKLFTIKHRTLGSNGKSMIDVNDDGNTCLDGTPYQWEMMYVRLNIISWVNIDSNIWSGGTQ